MHTDKMKKEKRLGMILIFFFFSDEINVTVYVLLLVKHK